MSHAIRTLITTVLVAICFDVCASVEASYPRTLVVITSDERPVSGVERVAGVAIEVLNLDGVATIERTLGDGLPNDPKRAEAIVKQRISDLGRAKLDADIRDAYRGLAVMMAQGFNRYPVMIFDQRAVVFGVTDVAVGVHRYRQWLEHTREASPQ